MDRHELGDEIAQEILADTSDTVILQKRPYTGVQIWRTCDEKIYEATAFAKVKWPDKWDPDYGIEIAVKKAAYDIARQICADA